VFLGVLLFYHPGPARSSQNEGYGLSLSMVIVHYVKESMVYEADINGDGIREAAVVLPDGAIRLFTHKKKVYLPLQDKTGMASRDVIDSAAKVRKAEMAAGLHFTAHRLESALLSLKCSDQDVKKLRQEMISEIRHFVPSCLQCGNPYLQFRKHCTTLIDSLPSRLHESGMLEVEGNAFLNGSKSACHDACMTLNPLPFAPSIDKYVKSGEKIVIARKPSRACKTDGWVILLSGGGVEMTVPAIFGIDAAHDKIRQGDKRTPEGEFRFCGKNAKSEYHRFIEIGYPNEEDARRGLREKMISKNEHDRIISALAGGQAPPYDTALGGEVGLHGLPVSCSDATLHHEVTVAGNWSFGCIVVLNRDIEALWEKIQVGDTIFVFRE
jgi:hypothetical protein